MFYRFLTLTSLFFSAGAVFAQGGAGIPIASSMENFPLYFPLQKDDLLRMSSAYGYRKHPIHDKIMFHQGIDLVARKGKPVYATGAGTVETADYEKGYGNRVIIVHLGDVKTLYAHLWLKTVKQGQAVRKGQLIGFVGDTGQVTGPHLHYELWIKDKKVDPMLIWKKIIAGS